MIARGSKSNSRYNMQTSRLINSKFHERKKNATSISIEILREQGFQGEQKKETKVVISAEDSPRWIPMKGSIMTFGQWTQRNNHKEDFISIRNWLTGYCPSLNVMVEVRAPLYNKRTVENVWLVPDNVRECVYALA